MYCCTVVAVADDDGANDGDSGDSLHRHYRRRRHHHRGDRGIADTAAVRMTICCQHRARHAGANPSGPSRREFLVQIRPRAFCVLVCWSVVASAVFVARLFLLLLTLL